MSDNNYRLLGLETTLVLKVLKKYLGRYYAKWSVTQVEQEELAVAQRLPGGEYSTSAYLQQLSKPAAATLQPVVR